VNVGFADDSMYNIKANPYAGSHRRWYVAVTTAMSADETGDAVPSWNVLYSVDEKTTEEFTEP
jgi:hypothetical protein